MNRFLAVLVLCATARFSTAGTICSYNMTPNTQIPGGVLAQGANTPDLCQNACDAQSTCVSFDFNLGGSTCWLLTTHDGQITMQGVNHYDKVCTVDPCNPNPCKNGGSCSNNGGNAVCSCLPGWTGSDCGTYVNPCSPNPCGNGACSSSGGSNTYSCSCPPGWTGTNCQTYVNPCSPNPCGNGACSSSGGNAYSCSCPAGWTGSNCQTYVNPCSPNPCGNGGSCSSSGGNTYSCSCPPGWTGSNCQTYVDPCSTNPCANGGTCSNNGGSAVCTCPYGWAGSTCQTSTCRRLDLLKLPNIAGALTTNYIGGAAGLLSPSGGIPWTFGIASFSFPWPSSGGGINLGINIGLGGLGIGGGIGGSSGSGQQITSITFASLTNAAFMRIDFVDNNGQSHLTGPITSSPYTPSGISSGSKVTVYLQPNDYTQNVSVSGLKIFTCTPGLFGCSGSNNIFGNSGGLLGSLVNIVTLGILQIGADGSVSWSTLMDVPYFEIDLNRLGYGVTEMNKVQLNQVSGIGNGRVKMWLQGYPVTLTNNNGLMMDIFGPDPATPGAMSYYFAPGLKCDRIRVSLYPTPNTAQSASRVISFQFPSIVIC